MAIDSPTTIQAQDVRNEDLRVGDVVKLWRGEVTIVNIRPYNGPLRDIIFAIADTRPGSGFSLEKRQWTTVLNRPAAKE